jgi:hypothetical protein
MSNDCPFNINLIDEEENIGDSLTKINNNFKNLKDAACAVEDQLDNIVSVRTFFYYGPNAPTVSEAGIWDQNPNTGISQDFVTSRPSNQTIENFVNQPGQLNLPAISQKNDVVYVIYQKTGFLSKTIVDTRTGSGTVPFQRTIRVKVVRRIGICFAPGTLIQTPNGNKPIEDFKVGDAIYCFDPATKEKVISKVVKTFKGSWKEAGDISPLFEFTHEKGSLQVTADHWIYTGNPDQLFKAAKELTTDDYLILEDGSKSKILNIEQKEKYEHVYNLNVEKYHNFIANNVLTGDYQTDNYVTLNKNKNNVPIKNGVATPNGFIDIKDINVGDIIYGFDTGTLELVEQRVKQKNINKTMCVKITHRYGELIVPEHQRLFVNEQYILATKLKPGNYLSVLENTEVYTPYYDIESEIINIEHGLYQDVIELSTSGNHNYIFNNVLIHNGGGGGGGGRRVTYEPRIETYYVGYNWTANINDTYLQYAPIFVIYRLTYNGVQYLSDSGYPKFSRGSTASTINWNNPQLWSTY